MKAGNVDFAYHTAKEDDEWKINFVKELIDVRNDHLDVAGMDSDELEEILESGFHLQIDNGFPSKPISSI